MKATTACCIGQPLALPHKQPHWSASETELQTMPHWNSNIAYRLKHPESLVSMCLLTLISLLPYQDLNAQEAFQFSVRGGPIWLKTDNVTGKELVFGDIPLPGSTLSVEDETHYGLILSWALTQNISLETALSTPVNLGVHAGGGVLGEKFRAGKVDVLPIVLIGRYTPEWNIYGIQPFVGLGVTYLVFQNPETTEKFDSLAAALGAHDASVKADDQLQPLIELGLDYPMGDRWFANATWMYSNGTDQESVRFSNGSQLISDVDYEVHLFALTLGYRF